MNQAIEAKVLCNIVQLGEFELFDQLSPAHFYFYKDIYQKAEELYNRYGSIDSGALIAAYGERFTGISDYDYAGPATIDELKKLYKEKRLIDIIASTKTSEEDPDEKALKMVDDLQIMISEGEVDLDDDFETVIDEAINYLESADDLDEQAKYKTGIDFIDQIANGLHRSELTTIAARSGIGKTSMALQIAWRLACNGLKVLFISREMGREQLANRIMAQATGINGHKFRRKMFTKREWEIIHGFREQKKTVYITLDHTTSTPKAIRKRIMKEKFDVVFVDYIQILSPDESMPNREREVASVSRSLKNMTQEFNIPIVALSQLNDNAGKYRPSGERDMRESKAIFQDSNNVLFIHKMTEPDEYESYIGRTYFGYTIEATDFDEYDEKRGYDIAEVMMVKQRDGMTGKMVYKYFGGQFTFAEINTDKISLADYKSVKVSEKYKERMEINF